MAFATTFANFLMRPGSFTGVNPSTLSFSSSIAAKLCDGALTKPFIRGFCRRSECRCSEVLLGSCSWNPKATAVSKTRPAPGLASSIGDVIEDTRVGTAARGALTAGAPEGADILGNVAIIYKYQPLVVTLKPLRHTHPESIHFYTLS